MVNIEMVDIEYIKVLLDIALCSVVIFFYLVLWN